MPDPNTDLLKDIVALRAAHDKTSMYMAVAAIVAIFLKYAIDFLQSIKSEELSDKGKHAIPWICSVLGIATAIAAKYGAGDTWTNAIILGGGAPAAVLFHNLTEALKGLLVKKEPPMNKPLSVVPPSGPAAALVLIFASLALSGCGPLGKTYAINLAACGVGKLPQVVNNVLPVVKDVLISDPGWGDSLKGLGIEVGSDVVTCAVKAAIDTWTGVHGQLSPEVQRGVVRGQKWLSDHGVK
jgi:hypothetical protein